jgi:hypothetical protein
LQTKTANLALFIYYIYRKNRDSIMNKKVKIATLVTFAAAFSVFGVKPALALDFGKAMGSAIKSADKSAGKSAGKIAQDVLKAADKLMEPKGPLKYIQIVNVPSEYEGYYAQVMATVIENPIDVCMPAYLTLGYQNANPALIDSVQEGKVMVHTPCDDKKRLIALTLTKTKDENNTTGAGFIYAKDSGLDACKSKVTMPAYVLSEKQIFHFVDFIKNEDCNAVADAATKKSKK